MQKTQDSEENPSGRSEEEARLRDLRASNITCGHDRSAERTVMDMPLEKKLEACRNFRRTGNLFHEEGQYRRAALQYRQALVYYDFCFPDQDEGEIQRELDEIRQACLLNSAACFLRCRELDETLDCCYQALQEDPDNVKALYRRAVVYRLRDQFECRRTSPHPDELRVMTATLPRVHRYVIMPFGNWALFPLAIREATADLAKALAQRPNDVMLRKEKAILKSKIASYANCSKALGQQMFGGSAGGRQGEGEVSTSGGDARELHEGGEDLDDEFPRETEAFFPQVGGDYYGDGVSGTASRSGVSKDDKAAGRRRHDMSVPVCVDIHALERLAGCAWPGDLA